MRVIYLYKNNVIILNVFYKKQKLSICGIICVCKKDVAIGFLDSTRPELNLGKYDPKTWTRDLSLKLGQVGFIYIIG